MAAISASKLGALTIEESLKRANVEKEAVEEVYMGNVLPGTQYVSYRKHNSLFPLKFSRNVEKILF